MSIDASQIALLKLHLEDAADASELASWALKATRRPVVWLDLRSMHGPANATQAGFHILRFAEMFRFVASVSQAEPNNDAATQPVRWREGHTLSQHDVYGSGIEQLLLTDQKVDFTTAARE
jgi:hypothetical protein